MDNELNITALYFTNTNKKIQEFTNITLILIIIIRKFTFLKK